MKICDKTTMTLEAALNDPTTSPGKLAALARVGDAMARIAMAEVRHAVARNEKPDVLFFKEQ